MKEDFLFSEPESFLKTSLKPDQILHTSSTKKLEELKSSFKAIMNACAEKVHEEIFTIRKEKELKVFIQNCQFELNELSNCIFSYRLEVKTDAHKFFYSEILDDIEHELKHLERHFPYYINYDGLLPLMRVEYLQKSLEESRSDIVLFLKNHHASDELTDIVQYQIAQVLNEDKRKLLFLYQYNYWKDFINDIIENQFTFFSESDFSFNAALQFLIIENFNCSRLFHLLVIDFQRMINVCEKDDEKITKTLMLVKHLQQLNIKTSNALNPLMPPLTEQLFLWLKEELQFLERSQKLSIDAQVVNKKNNHLVIDKLNSTLSVDQLSIIFRAAADIGIIEKKSYKSLFENIAPYLATPYTKNISADSLRSKAYVAENRDKQVVKDLLMELYKKINSY